MWTKIFYGNTEGIWVLLRTRGVWLRQWESLKLGVDSMIIAWVLKGLDFKDVPNHLCGEENAGDRGKKKIQKLSIKKSNENNRN